MDRQRMFTRCVTWTRSVTLEKAKIEKRNDAYTQTMTQVLRERVEEVSADFALEIDLNQLFAQLAAKAKKSRSGKSQMASGVIRVVRKSAEHYLSAKEVQHPVREGWTVVEPA